MKRLANNLTSISVIAVAALLCGCSDPKLTVSFRNDPSDFSRTANEIDAKLAEKGIVVTRQIWENGLLVSTVDTELDKAAFQNVVAEIMTPLKWQPRPKSAVTVTVTEQNPKVLAVLSLKTGQTFRSNLDWDSAKSGIYGLRTTGNEDVEEHYFCGVKVPAEGEIPSLRFGTDLSGERESTQEIMKLFRAMMPKDADLADHEIALEGLDSDKSPWQRVEFVAARSASGNADGAQSKDPVATRGDAFFIFEDCEPQNDLSLIDPKVCQLSDSACASVIRERVGGDFFGVTGSDVKGNVSSFEAIW